MSKRWLIKKQPETTKEKGITKLLSSELGISEKLSTLLWQRGVSDFEEAKYFFRPKLEDLHDPFLMKDMDRAVARLQKAVDSKEKVLVFGDYDVDGTTAVALVYGFLSRFYDGFEYYNPDRYKEGYGISIQGIEYAASKGMTLIIALDCGIKSVELIELAKTKYGIDFIICDHHEPGAVLPKAAAVLDPKRKDCPYPFKELTGNGVGFKLLTAFSIKNNISENIVLEYIDLAMVSIGSDIVPIVGENRILAYYGLKKINENPIVGLKALKQVAGFQGNMSIENVVFTIGPRINAAGRIKHAKAAVELLLEPDLNKALAFAQKIQAHNTERRGLDSAITGEALHIIENDDWIKNAKTTVLYKEDWHKGVIGIVASRCIEHYYTPTIIFTKSKEGIAAGSARSVEGFDLYSAVEACSDLLEQFGGHMHAAGMTIKIENIEAFKQKFEVEVSKRIEDHMLIEDVHIDLEVDLSDLDAKFYRIMVQMAPFGPNNLRPVFMSSNLKLASEPKVLKEKHLKLEILEPETGVVFSAIGFGMADRFYKQLKQKPLFSAAYSLDVNTFRGVSSLQLFLKDLKVN